MPWRVLGVLLLDARTASVARSEGYCEAMVPVRGVFTRCGAGPVDSHHRLRRSQGGNLLDSLGEIYHLVCLCRRHHEWAHRRVGEATEAGLFVDGYVIRDGTRIIYRGQDEYLRSHYGDDVQ